MRFIDRIYISFTGILPAPYVKYITSIMRYSGMQQKTAFYLGSGAMLSLLVFLITIMYTTYFTALGTGLRIGVSILSMFGIQLFLFLVIYFKIENRAEEVDKALPDQLQIMSNNIKSGMTPFNALKLSARKEFGLLSREIKEATNRAGGSQSFVDTLLSIKERVKSVTLERVLKLEVASIKTGGNFSDLLTELANDIRETQALRNDLLTKTKTYTAFILFTILLGTPTLLSISIHFVEMINDFSSITDNVNTDSASFDIGFGGGESIEPAFLVKLSYAVLFITTLLASMLLGVINKGKALYGLRYSPVLVILGLIIFSIARLFIGSFFGGMI